MKSTLKFVLSYRLRGLGINKSNSGFTLIELLVAMLLAVLIITPLMGFMIDILRTDGREQAKATSEQEIQAALDFINRDLQQAVYIYDADGVTRGRTGTDVANFGIRQQIPPLKPTDGCDAKNASDCQPILVFWKREYISDSVGVSRPDDNNRDGGFAYSLVAYYLINNPNGNGIWSKTARIARFQIRGQVNSANAINNKGVIRTGSGATATLKPLDAGFMPPPLSRTISGATLKERMNQWEADTNVARYSQPVVTLVDYIDTARTTARPINCPNPVSAVGSNTTGFQGTGNNTSGFYACVNASEVVAQIHLRGNAAIRVNEQSSDSTFFPSTSARIQGRGFVATQ